MIPLMTADPSKINAWQRVLLRCRDVARTPKPPLDLRPYWRACGYRAAGQAPEPVVRANGFASVLRHIPLQVYDQDAIAGSTAGFRAAMPPQGVSGDDFLNAVQEHDRRSQRTFGSGFDHTLADYPTLLAVGIPGILDRIEQARRQQGDPELNAALQAMAITVGALADFAERYAHQCDQHGQTNTAETLRHIATKPPGSFRQAIQLLWLTHIAFCSEGRRHMALGRIDQLLLPFYQADLNRGALDRSQALDLLCNLWAKVAELGEVTNICIGGLTPEGRDGTNDLSYLALEATRLVQSPHTNLSARFHDGTPQAFHRACWECIRTGIGFPAIFNDQVLIPGLVRIGIPVEVARDHCMVGCIETMLAGRQPAWSDGRFNAPLYLCNALQKLRHEPRQDDATLKALFIREMRQGMAAYVQRVRDSFAAAPPERLPDPFLSALTRDCIARGRDVNDGGAEFPRFHGVAIMGLATVADSLAAVQKLVFEEKRIGFEPLMQALDTDFQDQEPLRRMLLNRAPKYGNDEPAVDRIAAWIVTLAAQLCLEHRFPDGGRFVAAMAANVSNIPAGKEVPATPDGRRAYTPLSDAASPFFGRDRRGPTAFLKSVATPDYSNVLTGSVINMKFEPDCFAGPGGADLFLALSTRFVRDRIPQLQFNVTGDELLREARDNPGLHPNLVVRVSGFSAYFVQLAPTVQDDVIRRRSHRSGSVPEALAAEPISAADNS